MKQFLFLYGSSDVGQVHFLKISTFIKSLKRACMRGTIYRLSCGYPILSTDGETLIEGKLAEIEAPESFWPILDELFRFNPQTPKKGLFIRSTREAYIDNFSRVSTEVYVANPLKSLKDANVISDGTWSLNQSESELTERQKTYIQKLSRAKGRDIVPIELDLYRELLSKQLIVDKGRRLALTKLGQEISYFL